MAILVYIREFFNQHIGFLSKKFHKFKKKAVRIFTARLKLKKKDRGFELPWSFEIL